MSASLNLTSLAELKLYLGISDTDSDDLLNALIARVSQAIESYIGAEVMSKARTEYYDAEGLDRFTLRQRPVDRTAPFTLTQDTSVPRDFDSETPLTTADYLIDYSAGIVQRNSGNFPNSGPESVKVVYTAGWAALTADVPDDLKIATELWCAEKYNKADQGGEGIKSERMGAYAVTYDTAAGGVPDYVAQILDGKYREYFV